MNRFSYDENTQDIFLILCFVHHDIIILMLSICIIFCFYLFCGLYIDFSLPVNYSLIFSVLLFNTAVLILSLLNIIKHLTWNHLTLIPKIYYLYYS